MDSLPVQAILPSLRSALGGHTAAVVVAPPGAGKTTGIPPALLDEPWMAGKRLVLLSPRRVAARAAAGRMAAMLGEPVGRTVGFRVRLESRTSAATRIEVVTEGVFTRMILADPALDGVAAVLFDEFHERSLEGDLGLALALDMQSALREDLRVVVMSATLDGARVRRLLDDAPLIVSEGRLHPVAIRHQGSDLRVRIEDRMAAAIESALFQEEGGILAFLPGAGEIERTAQRLREKVRDPSVDLHVLYGALDARAQDAAIAPAEAGRRKVVLATSIAETSLTLDGVRIVIDSGLARRPRYEPSTGLTRLETVRASRAAVDQRAGRAGRTGPGVCWRLWDEGETRALAAFDRPEILEADLAGFALDLAAWGVRDPASLRWLDPPPAAAWIEAQTVLRDLGALNADGRLTAQGSAVAELPLHPRLAHMVMRAGQVGAARMAARLAMVLSEQGLGGRDADLAHRLDLFDQDRSPRANAARRMADNIARKTGCAGGGSDVAVGCLLLHAFPERVAKARGRRGEFLLANGRAGAVDETEALAQSQFLVVADLAGRADRSRILAAAVVSEQDIETALAARIVDEETVAYDDKVRAVRARRIRRLGRIVLSDAPTEHLDAARVAAALREAIRVHGLDLLSWSQEGLQFRARVGLLRRLDGVEWPDLSDAALKEDLGAWLPIDSPRLDDITPPAIARAVEALLPYALRRRLEAEAPARFVTPAGGDHRIDYLAENGPALDVRLQELFGVAEHPAVAGGRAPLLLRLLSPAGRPVQTTRDLPGFWRGSYAAVRVEMKGRYPKHPWPEDPISATPTRRAKPRGS